MLLPYIFINSAIQRGVHIPEDIFVTGFSDMCIGQHCKPDLTTIAMDFFAVGISAFQAWQFLQKSREDSHTKIKLTVSCKTYCSGKHRRHS